MTTRVQSVLDAFEALSDSEKHEVFVEILHRSEHSITEPLLEEALRAAADMLFRELDEREDADARPEPR